jgi:glutamine amidotransferase
MRIRVAIIDYDLGNLYSVNNICRRVGLDVIITSDVKQVSSADALILPGVGAFGDAMENLRKKELIDPIYDFIKQGKPFLGICLGMQLMFTESEEFGNHKGLDLIPGNIIRFPSVKDNSDRVKVPQIQWNQVYNSRTLPWEKSVMKGVQESSFMYFVHSYYAKPTLEENILSYSEYAGIRYASAVMKENMTGIQYHPEKSAEGGIKIYQNWANYIKKQTY